jgi:hypothetical protein
MPLHASVLSSDLTANRKRLADAELSSDMKRNRIDVNDLLNEATEYDPPHTAASEHTYFSSEAVHPKRTETQSHSEFIEADCLSVLLGMATAMTNSSAPASNGNYIRKPLTICHPGKAPWSKEDEINLILGVRK